MFIRNRFKKNSLQEPYNLYIYNKKTSLNDCIFSNHNDLNYTLNRQFDRELNNNYDDQRFELNDNLNSSQINNSQLPNYRSNEHMNNIQFDEKFDNISNYNENDFDDDFDNNFNDDMNNDNLEDHREPTSIDQNDTSKTFDGMKSNLS